MNDRRTYHDASEAQNVLQGLMWVGEQLKLWRQRTQNRNDIFLTSQTYFDLMLVCEGVPFFAYYVWTSIENGKMPDVGFRPKTLSQDPLEQTFGDLRQRGGGDNDITLMSAAYNLRSINLNKLTAFKLRLPVKEPTD